MSLKWDQTFVELAGWWAQRVSKDPSTKVGAVVVRPDRTIASIGYNGFPRGVVDNERRMADRSLKYPFTVHAEANSIVTAREPLHGYILYCTHCPCANCCGLVIQSGITRIVTPYPSSDIISRWGKDFDVSKYMCQEAGVSLEFIGDPDVA